MKYDFSATGYAITDEVLVRTDNQPARIAHDLLKAGGFEIWTGAGKTGTNLTPVTDFALTVKDDKRTTRAGFDLFTMVSILNAAYFGVTLYLTYTTCGDYLSVANVLDLVAEVSLSSDVVLSGNEGTVDLGLLPVGAVRSYIKTGSDNTKYYSLDAPAGASISGIPSVLIYGQYDRATISRLSETLFVLKSDVAPGTIQEDGGTVLPPGWIWADGATLSRSTYATLFGRVGTAWGAGDGSTTFVAPDLREASPYGTGTRGAGVTAHDTRALGAFADDRFQKFKVRFGYWSVANGGGVGNIYTPAGTSGYVEMLPIADTEGTPRTGATTRGKTAGVNFRVKVI